LPKCLRQITLIENLSLCSGGWEPVEAELGGFGGLVLAERGLVATHESIRLWCTKFGSDFAGRLAAAARAYRGCVMYASTIPALGTTR